MQVADDGVTLVGGVGLARHARYAQVRFIQECLFRAGLDDAQQIFIPVEHFALHVFESGGQPVGQQLFLVELYGACESRVTECLVSSRAGIGFAAGGIRERHLHGVAHHYGGGFADKFTGGGIVFERDEHIDVADVGKPAHGIIHVVRNQIDAHQRQEVAVARAEHEQRIGGRHALAFENGRFEYGGAQFVSVIYGVGEDDDRASVPLVVVECAREDYRLVFGGIAAEAFQQPAAFFFHHCHRQLRKDQYLRTVQLGGRQTFFDFLRMGFGVGDDGQLRPLIDDVGNIYLKLGDAHERHPLASEPVDVFHLRQLSRCRKDGAHDCP